MSKKARLEVQANSDDYRHLPPTPASDAARVSERERVYRTLAEKGFICARWLPLYRSDAKVSSLRPVNEIAGRLLALKALFIWVASPEDIVSSEKINSFIERSNLKPHLTADELKILKLTRKRANSKHQDSIGWKLENMWALSWILGFEHVPLFYVGQIPREISDDMMLDFIPKLDSNVNVNDFISSKSVRSIQEISDMEDLYYCAHNAVRGAQMGEQTLPQNFDPFSDGGATHERRHALTWALSPGVRWDLTDLST